MQKIISLFKRDYEGTCLVYDEIVEGAEWVANGEGKATRKWDGTCCIVQDGKLFRRYDAKHGKTPPEGFIAAQAPDPNTGHWPGWILVGDDPGDRWHREAWEYGCDCFDHEFINGQTYELCGPKVQGNPERFSRHLLVPHGLDNMEDAPRTFHELRDFLAEHDYEGIVWHHPDGRMVKIKAKDFGIKRVTA